MSRLRRDPLSMLAEPDGPILCQAGLDLLLGAAYASPQLPACLLAASASASTGVDGVGAPWEPAQTPSVR